MPAETEDHRGHSDHQEYMLAERSSEPLETDDGSLLTAGVRSDPNAFFEPGVLRNSARKLIMGSLIVAAAGMTTALVVAGASEKDPASGRPAAGTAPQASEIEQPETDSGTLGAEAPAPASKKIGKPRKSRHTRIGLRRLGWRRAGGTHARIALGSSGSAKTQPSRATTGSDDQQPQRENRRKKRKKPEKVSASYGSSVEPIPSSDRATTNLYHLYNPDTDDHFFTSSMEEKSSKQQEGYKQKAIIGRVFDEHLAGTSSLTTDNGPVGWIFDEQREGSIPVHFLRGPGQAAEGDLYTSNDATRERWEVDRGWMYLGIRGYIPAPL